MPCNVFLHISLQYVIMYHWRHSTILQGVNSKSANQPICIEHTWYLLLYTKYNAGWCDGNIKQSFSSFREEIGKIHMCMCMYSHIYIKWKWTIKRCLWLSAIGNQETKMSLGCEELSEGIIWYLLR